MIAFAAVAAAGIIDIPAIGTQDAVVGANFDFWPPPAYNVDIPQVSPTAYFRIAPTGRDELYRTAPGAIIEDRVVTEFNLSPLASLTALEILSVVLTFEIDQITTTATWASPTLIVRGYDGSGAVDDSTFDNPVATLLATLTPGGSGTQSIDVTPFIRDLVSRHVAYAGINMRLDASSLPDRSTLADDSDFRIVMKSAETLEGPVLSVTATPEPSAFALVGATLLGAAWHARRRRR